MTLVRVAEYVSKIFVNGTEEASFDQRDDANYDLNISTSSSISPSTVTVLNIQNDFLSPQESIPDYAVNTDFVDSGTTFTYDVTVSVDSDASDSVEFSVGGNTFIVDQGETVSKTYTISGGLVDVYANDANEVGGTSCDYDLKITAEVSSSSSFNVDSVSKQ